MIQEGKKNERLERGDKREKGAEEKWEEDTERRGGEGRGGEGGMRQTRNKRRVMDGQLAADGRIKKGSSEEGECERESTDGVIALQRSSDKQHLRASVVK